MQAKILIFVKKEKIGEIGTLRKIKVF